MRRLKPGLGLGLGLGAGTAAEAGAAAARARELLQSIMEEISGGRMHYMFNRVGGLKEELPAGWLGRVGAAAARCAATCPGSARSSVAASGSAAGPATWAC